MKKYSYFALALILVTDRPLIAINSTFLRRYANLNLNHGLLGVNLKNMCSSHFSHFTSRARPLSIAIFIMTVIIRTYLCVFIHHLIIKYLAYPQHQQREELLTFFTSPHRRFLGWIGLPNNKYRLN